jgi:hypothetical protein
MSSRSSGERVLAFFMAFLTTNVHARCGVERSHVKTGVDP